MQALVTVNKGAENICAKEISEIVKCKNIVIKPTIVKFEITDIKELHKIYYKAQSISRAIFLLCEFKVDKSLIKSSETLSKEVKKIDFPIKEKTYKVVCVRKGEHDFNSIDITKKISDELFDKYKLKADFKNPEILFFAYIINNKGYLGIDYGFDLSKRQYKIFNHPESLKGTTGFVVAKESGLKGIIVDSFMGSGIIPIEATLSMLNFPIRYYDKDKFRFEIKDEKFDLKKTTIYGFDSEQRFVNAAKKNAALSGIDKYITLEKLNVSNLKEKFDKNTVDYIITDPPRETKYQNLTRLEKTYNEFFENANIILKNKGKIIIITPKTNLLEKAAENHKFKIMDKYALNQGKEIFTVIKLERG